MMGLLIFYIVFSYFVLLGVRQIMGKETTALIILLAPISFPFIIGEVLATSFRANRQQLNESCEIPKKENL